ncbi:MULTISPECIES: MFS transporter [unclassified Curtobacterium]|uniref:MFS transporter n=1 Tax=unclassified Curtobacterium TaxID=257496 RepID=UPI000DA9B34C|nr:MULTISPECIES: MFS transporter [unclassified Curtobacterium]PZE36148.1 MFS transporter [Curtobacterium sp. MCPF17_031]PZF12643.1 MFS transporter [Curtobacterium sp. MCPF17_011]
MSAAPATPTSATKTNPRSRVVIASLVGTSIEFYDFYVYATAAVLVFPTLFFPNEDPTASQLSSFVTFALAFFARPVGSILFGHFGDRVGRKTTLVASLLVMGTATFLIGCLPTFGSVGVLAPVLLAVLRFAQGVGLGGEWSGAALLATENAPEGKRGVFGSMPQLGAPIGFLLANGLFIIINAALPAGADGTPNADFQAWGWRIPFLVSSVLVLIGLYVRFRLVESTVFRGVQESGSVAKVPLGRVFRTSWRAVVVGTFGMVATYVLFYFMTTFTLNYGTAGDTASKLVPKIGLGYSRGEFLSLLMIGVVFFGICTPIAGLLADRFGRRRTLIPTTIGIALFGLTFQFWFAAAHGPITVVTFLIVGLSLMGLTFGPMGALLPELFPTNVRYTGSALAYNVASILGASLAPTIALKLWQPDGNIFLVGLYLTIAAVVTLVALFLVRETRGSDLADTVDDQPAVERVAP